MATKQTNVRLSEEGRTILAELKPQYGSEAKVIDAALGLIKTPAVKRDAPTVSLDGLSAETLERIDKLVSDYNYPSRQAVIESAIETLYTIVTGEQNPPKSVSRPTNGANTAMPEVVP